MLSSSSSNSFSLLIGSILTFSCSDLFGEAFIKSVREPFVLYGQLQMRSFRHALSASLTCVRLFLATTQPKHALTIWNLSQTCWVFLQPRRADIENKPSCFPWKVWHGDSLCRVWGVFWHERFCACFYLARCDASAAKPLIRNEKKTFST